MTKSVLVTGGSGFVGKWCIVELLNRGYAVRTTVRSLRKEAAVRTAVGSVVDAGDRLTFLEADLAKDEGWDTAAAGCDYVLHVASPFPASMPEDENEVIGPARDGALRVLRAAHRAAVRRVVLTSSFAAIGYGQASRETPFNETDWTSVNDSGLSTYVRSKTLAERAAWDFIATEGGGLELSVVNPVGIFGPVLDSDLSSSVLIVQRLLDGKIPGCPQLYFGVVDVRDVADLHVRAMTDVAAKGERFIAVAGQPLSMLQVARVLRAHMGASARRVPVRQIPNWLMRIMALANPAAREVLPELGNIRRSSNEKAKRILNWAPRSSEEAIAASGQSLLRLGLLKDGAKSAVS